VQHPLEAPVERNLALATRDFLEARVIHRVAKASLAVFALRHGVEIRRRSATPDGWYGDAESARACADPEPLSQSAIFNFQSLLTVILLLICTCTYVHAYSPSLLDNHKRG
jgi:hypothetical protein